MILDNKTILITGGTGSFGKKFVEIALKYHQPKAIRVFSRDELKQSQMQQEFQDEGIRYFVGDIRDKDRLYRAMNGTDIVVHAAALKQVPSCEYNPMEAIKTNILGTANVIDAAIDNNVEKAIFISTDKAVNPINLYGATKLCAEKLFVQANSYRGEKKTRFSCTRYGNVIGSRGSVVPLFCEQKKNGILTITDERMKRFWITLEQGVNFVINCIGKMKGGEIFVPKIPSMMIVDLAKAIAPEAEITLIGIRPGEKINEVLLTQEEARRSREFDDYFVIEPEHFFWGKEDSDNGKFLADGFQYASDNNSELISKEQIEEILKDFRHEI